jgi:hypothetical protein
MIDKTVLGFRLFIALWNAREQRQTPKMHFDIATWLEQAWIKSDTRLLLMAFRSSGKSTLAGLFAAWLLYRNPDLRILVLAADYMLASKMVQQVKKIIETHPLTSHLKPEKPDEWARTRFTVNRKQKLRDPSMLARGVTSNITGSRADIIIYDDVEVPKTSETQEKREALRERLMESGYVLTPDGTQLYIGTPHTYYSIYADKVRLENDEETIFLDGFKRFSIPLFNEKGDSAWPEKYTPLIIEKMAAQNGPNKFASQMMLKAVNIVNARLDSSLLKIYNEELDYTKELQALYIGQKKMISASGWWDPSFGSVEGDNSVLAAAFAGEDGNFYIHHVEYIKVQNKSEEAIDQCRQIAHLARKLYLPSLTVESNGLGRFLPNLLRNEMAKAKAPCAVTEFFNAKPKDLRILEAFDALLAAGKIHVHKSVLQTPFITEMQEWRPGRKRGHDDGLDAVAGTLSQQPVRIKRIYGKGQHTWMQGAPVYKAKTEFDT